MSLPSLNGAQKTRLRGLGQQLDDMLLVGQAGASPTLVAELNRMLDTHELVKVRFAGADRVQRASLTEALAAAAACLHVGSVGFTALFYRPNAEPGRRKIEL